MNEAGKLEVHVMETRKRVLSQENPSILTSMGSLASTFWNQGFWKEVEELELEVQAMETKKWVAFPTCILHSCQSHTQFSMDINVWFSPPTYAS